mgnify:CR=1 FL=1|tara:strand:- start:493 stop:1038 length:546 start_codon:yes stop_codon:yes gene_type:complete
MFNRFGIGFVATVIITIALAACNGNEGDSEDFAAYSNAEDLLQDLTAEGYSIHRTENLDYFARIGGRVVYQDTGRAVTSFEIGYKPGVLTGKDLWETEESVSSTFGPAFVMSMNIYPDEPWNWESVSGSQNGQFSILLYDKVETVTIFVKNGSAKPTSMELKGLAKGSEMVDLIVYVPEGL